MDSPNGTDASASTSAMRSFAPLWRAYRPAVWTVAAVGIAVNWIWLGNADHSENWLAVSVIIALANLADALAIRVRQRMRVSTAPFAVPFAIIVASPLAGLIAAITCFGWRLARNRHDFNSFDVAVNIVAGSASALVWHGFTDNSPSASPLGIVVTVLSFAVLRQLLNLGWTLEYRARDIPIPVVNRQVAALMLVCAILFVPAISMFVGNGHTTTTWSLFLIVLPFVATHYLVQAFGREIELNRSLEEANLSLTESLVNALDARDPYSAGHSIAVAVYARDIAAELGLSAQRVRRVYLGGLLHDVGKIAVADAILRKPAALNEEEFAEIRKHPVVGEQILAPSRHYADILPAVRHHHERIDGRGYPDQLVDDEIPLAARIVAVADAYNAMTSSRPYRDAMEPMLACRILRQNQGRQHDPMCVAAFTRVLERHDDAYARATGDDFAAAKTINDLVYGDELEAARTLGLRLGERERTQRDAA